MSTRQPDTIELATSSGTFDRFSRLTVTNDILGSAEATFETGDEASWPDVEKLLAPGEEVSVVLNGRPRLKGRAEIVEASAEPDGGLTAIITLRTRMADARYASADPKIKTNKTSVKDFVLACYAQLGLTEKDFQFGGTADVDLMTGKSNQTGMVVDMDPIKPEQAKITPPETVYEAVEKHLRRFGAYHWESASGKIVVAIPNDKAPPRYRLLAKSTEGGKGNNILRVRRVRDWSEVARVVWITGGTPGRETLRVSQRGSALDADVDAVATRTGHFRRLVLIPIQASETQQSAEKQAKRELSLRRRRKDGWEFSVDGWTYWTGSEQINYSPGLNVDVDVDALGGARGSYLITRTVLDLSLGGAVTTSLTCVAPGTLLS